MYIRTKYEIVKVETIADIQTKVIFKDNFVAQSKNLEELCDEFVIEYADGSKIISIHNNTDDFLREHKDEIESGYIKNVYGAIWVDGKGLIYVAKMNENGDLILI